MRFLLAGLATVTGLLLLFAASFGDPAAMVRRVRQSVILAFAPAGNTGTATLVPDAGDPWPQ
jgi:hypothetical protein